MSYEMVANDILLIELHDPDALNILESVHCIRQA